MPKSLKRYIKFLCFVFTWEIASRCKQGRNIETYIVKIKNSQLLLHTDEFGAEYLQYVGDVSKNNNRGLAHLQIKNKIAKAYENVEKLEHCCVKLYKKYVTPVPLDVPDDSFYLRVLLEIFGVIKN